MRTEENPLDLNNFPEDGKQTSEDSSMYAGVYRQKKNGANEDAGKVYECRFCSLKFCKSQALGGHMNRHRQERETETLNKARHLVFTNDLAPAHLGYVSSVQTINPHGGYHQAAAAMADPPLPFRTSMYPTRLFPTSSPPPQAASYMYTSSPQGVLSFSNQYLPPLSANHYFLGHVLSSTESNYTCIGAPVGYGFPNGRGGVEGAVAGDMLLLRNLDEGLNWGRR